MSFNFRRRLKEKVLILEVLRELIIEIKELRRDIHRLHHDQHSKVHLSLTTIINNSKFTIMALQLNQGQFSLDSLQLTDSDTTQKVDATFANVSFSSDNSSVLTSVQSFTTPTDVINTGIAVGSANVTAQADVTYVDSKTGVSVTKTLSVVVPFTVSLVSTPQNVELRLIQGTPQQA